MRAVKVEVTSSKPISLSKAAAVLSLFTASETGAAPDVAAYLRRTMASFEELTAAHREIRHQQNISQNDGEELLEKTGYNGEKRRRVGNMTELKGKEEERVETMTELKGKEEEEVGSVTESKRKRRREREFKAMIK